MLSTRVRMEQPKFCCIFFIPVPTCGTTSLLRSGIVRSEQPQHPIRLQASGPRPSNDDACSEQSVTVDRISECIDVVIHWSKVRLGNRFVRRALFRYRKRSAALHARLPSSPLRRSSRS